MIADLIFGVIVISLVVAFVLYVRETNKEKNKLVNALISKTPEQVRDLDLADRVQIKTQTANDSQPDLVPLENVSEDDFDQHIQDQLHASDTQS